jgi:hypothetical protein
MWTRETKSLSFYISVHAYRRNMQCIKVQFYNARGDDEGIMNRLVSYFDPPYCHCEVEFRDTLACAIYWGGKVHMRNRTFSSANYDHIELKCPQYDYDRALLLAHSKSSDGETFNLRQMIGSKIPALRGSTKGTFCSKLCAEILIAANLLPHDVNVAEMTPSKLFHQLNVMQGSCSTGSDTSIALDFVA